ncbi:MAG: prepilin peptidase [Lachnospiraceae bacterium]
MEQILIYFVIFLFGIVIGSFLNVCIIRIPEHTTIITDRSHCMMCGYQLAWFDLIPIFSYLFLKGRCRKCAVAISPQYPIVEGVNGIGYILVFSVYGLSAQSILYCLLTSALIVLTVIDWRIYEIPLGINVFILMLGILRLALEPSNWKNAIAGFLIVSIFLELILIASKGRAIGGGDVKLMAVAGLLLGWKLILLSFFLGCLFGSVIHLIRMKKSGQDRTLALGPYLSAGIFISALWGEELIQLYLKLAIY